MDLLSISSDPLPRLSVDVPVNSILCFTQTGVQLHVIRTRQATDEHLLIEGNVFFCSGRGSRDNMKSRRRPTLASTSTSSKNR